ncbi:MAG: VWA domain-containing protein [Acidobacteriaceae bacterium]|nr:VWA domain-containing protein [Acidobacteriaceae bacterium]
MRSGSLILFSAIVFSAGLVGGQDAGLPAAPAPPQPIIRAEKKLVLVDAVVTDKHGGYVHDLTAQDFRVWEDKKEQKIESFSFEADPKSPAVNQKHYLVLFFDNSDSSLTDQMIARKAALKFLDAAGKPNWMIAVADFGGSLQIVQNFTNDTDRLKQVVNGTRFGDNPGELASLAGGGPLGRAAYDFGARDVLLALRSLAKSLGTVPGRKTLIFLSPGFPLNDDLVRSELTALLDTCNKANVAIYPIDVKGLSTSLMLPQDRRQPSWTLVPAVFEGQHAGGGGGGATAGGGHGGGAPSGGGGGTHGGAPASGGNTAGGARTGNAGNYSGYNYGNYNRNTQPRTIWPHMNSIVSRQELLYALASGTGGFVIVNTNDLTGGLEKIANEQNEYYVLGYSPSEDPEEGSCHQLKVKVDRGGTEVRARTGYCTEKPLDLLAGTPTEKTLEARVFSPAAGNVKASMETPFFYTGPNTARVNVSMEISPDGLKFEKEKGKFRSEMHVLGVAYGPDGSVAAKFSDTIKLEVDGKKELEDFKEKPVFYAKQFDIASGNYLFKVAFTSAGDTFGKLQAPLIVEPYDNKKFGLSAIALSDRMSRLSNLDAGLDAQLLEDVVPLVAEGVQIQPSGSNVFKKGSPAAVYVEIYDPLLASANAPPKVGLQLRVIDPKTGQSKVDTGFMNMANFAKAGSPIMPVGLKLPDDTLGPGTYKLEAKAMDTAGNTSVVRTADFVLQ